jgi:hypothetical protein
VLPVFSPVTGANFAIRLENLLEMIKCGSATAVQDVHNFVDQIPILDPIFWAKVQDLILDRHHFVAQINRLSREYHKSLLRRSSKIRQEDYFVQIKLLKIADKLFKMQTMSGGWPMRRTLSFPLYFPLLRHVFNGEMTYCAPNPKWMKELQDIKKDWHDSEPLRSKIDEPFHSIFIPGDVELEYLYNQFPKDVKKILDFFPRLKPIISWEEIF